MRRDQDIEITKNNSQTDLIVVEDGDLTTADWLDLTNITGSDIQYQIAEGTVDENFDETDVVYEADGSQIDVITWGSTDAVWPDRLSDPDDGLGVSEPPDGTLIIQVAIPPEDTQDLLVTPVSGGTRSPELVRECKITSPSDFALQRTAITVVQGNVTVLPSTDDGTTA